MTNQVFGERAVAQCKAGFAQVIEQMLGLRAHTDDPEIQRMASVAITEAQTAQMWAVKALTWPRAVVLTDGDALADLNGTPRPDNPTH